MDVGQVVELRVHGVSGTPPEELLDRMDVGEVDGNRTAGFYRPTRLDKGTDDVDGHPGPRLEGYAWGGLTSGSPSRALWLLLLPFTLINVAPRLRNGPPAGQGGARTRAVLYVTQLMALALTMSLALAFTGVGVDLVAWQCRGGADCSNGRPAWLLRWIEHMAPGRSLVVGCLLPLAALATLAVISRGRVLRYEDAGDDGDTPPPGERGLEVGVDSVWMWRGRFRVRRLLHVHLLAGCAAVVAAPCWALQSGWRWPVLAACAVTVANAMVLLCTPSVVGPARTPAPVKVWIALSWVVLGVAGLATAAVLLWRTPRLVARHAPDYLAAGHLSGLPKYPGTVFTLFTVQTLMLIALFLLMRPWQGRKEPGPTPGLNGAGTVVLAGLGLVLGAVFSAGVYMYSAAYLRTGSFKPGLTEVRDVTNGFDVPEAIRDAALTYTVSLAVLALVLLGYAAWAGWTYWRITPARWPLLGTEFAELYPGRSARTARGRSICRAIWIAKLTDRAAAGLAIALVPGALLIAWVAIAFVGGRLGLSWFRHQTDVLSGLRPGTSGMFATSGWRSPAALTGLGAYAIVASTVGLIGLGAVAFRIRKTRRSVGILWDLASFWPRSIHPMAAPCYAERTVPDLSGRIRAYLDGADQQDFRARGIVLAAHSQGTVIAAAVVLQMNRAQPAALGRVGLLTFGCVLRRLYGRYFGAYFGEHALATVADALTGDRWINLWRHTDYLGGPVGFGPPGTGSPSLFKGDVLLVDPPYDRDPEFLAAPKAQRHSNFPADPEFQRHVAALATDL